MTRPGKALRLSEAVFNAALCGHVVRKHESVVGEKVVQQPVYHGELTVAFVHQLFDQFVFAGIHRYGFVIFFT